MSFFIILQKKYIQKKLLTFFIFLMDGMSLQNQLSTLRYPLTARCLKYFNLQKKKHSGHLFFSTFHAQKALDAAGTSWCSNLA